MLDPFPLARTMWYNDTFEFGAYVYKIERA